MIEPARLVVLVVGGHPRAMMIHPEAQLALVLVVHQMAMIEMPAMIELALVGRVGRVLTHS